MKKASDCGICFSRELLGCLAVVLARTPRAKLRRTNNPISHGCLGASFGQEIGHPSIVPGAPSPGAGCRAYQALGEGVARHEPGLARARRMMHGDIPHDPA